MSHILKCGKCGSYTAREECGCGGKAVSVKPMKYSPDDKYADLIRQAKRKGLVEKGLL
jgi:rRNA maturation protein Nop10